jgi:D-aspartate ligase
VNKQFPAVVLGMFETGLGVARSLGKEGIRVLGFDHKKDIGFYSRFVRPKICPHPVTMENEFIRFLIESGRKEKEKPVLFITSDNFILTISKNRERLSPYYHFNFPTDQLFKTIFNKFSQYELAKNAGIDVPGTLVPENLSQLKKVSDTLSYPVLIKGMTVSNWREKVGSSIKGYTATNPDELLRKCSPLFEMGVKLIVQEIIEGPDTNHYKYCAYYSSDGVPLLEFTLRKIRQQPVHFGVGAVVESIHSSEVMDSGSALFKGIGYRGVGSAEFKLDQKDGKFKLIEINPRYWQQNSLPTACGMNFPLYDYLCSTGQPVLPLAKFQVGIKWINRYMDFVSFMDYHKEKEITYKTWRKSLKGKKIYSDFIWGDPLPSLYELGFGKKLLKLPVYLYKNFFLTKR